MKYVDCGCGKIPYISLLAILSISLTVNLPGLAISPIMGKLDDVFTNVTELEIQFRLFYARANFARLKTRCGYSASVW